MKKLSWYIIGIVTLTFSVLHYGCKKTDEPNWDDEEQEAYDQVINLQDNVSIKLDEWFSSMDSLEAINKAQQEFAKDPGVSLATISSQGISVQYTNGMRGGILLNSKRGSDVLQEGNSLMHSSSPDNNHLKSMVSPNKMMFCDPTYLEFPTSHRDEIEHDMPNLERVNITFWTLDAGLTVENFTNLSGKGIVNISSHGWAWPKEENITDVYLLTGETVNQFTSKKYWDEIKGGNIPLIIENGVNKYWISPDFFVDNNDFSNDTILFIGSFCYSFLGGWPDIVESFADGAYVGYDWSVRVDYSSFWSRKIIEQMSDTSKQNPITLDNWMNDPNIVHSYFDSEDDKTVNVHYTGDGTLKLWGKTEVNILSLSTDGAPVDITGEADVPYPFKCNVISNVSELEYVWDIGDGSSLITTQANEVEITWSENGKYDLSVTVNNKSDNKEIGKDTVAVQIGDSPTWNNVYLNIHTPMVLKKMRFPEGDSSYINNDLNWLYDEFLRPGIYENGTFTATWDTLRGYSNGDWDKSEGFITLTIDEKEKKITGGSIHSKYISSYSPDSYVTLDITINEMKPGGGGWKNNNMSFVMEDNELCNPAFIANVHYENHQIYDTGKTIYTLKSYSCDDKSYFQINLRTE